MFGSPSTGQPYLRARASVNSFLFKLKPFALIGSVVSQFEAPTSCVISVLLLVSSGSSLIRSLRVSLCFLSLFMEISFLSDLIS